MRDSMSIYVKMIFVTLFWGGTFVAGRIASQTLAPAVSAFGRFAVASLFLLVLLALREKLWSRLTVRQIVLVIGGGLTGILAYNLLFFSGLKLIEANRASLIVALNPTVIMLAAAMLGMERLTPQRIAGLLIALLGVAIVLSEGNLAAISSSIGPGELLIGGCVLSWSAYTLIGRAVVKDLSPLFFTTYSSLAGGLGLLIPASSNLGEGLTMGLVPWMAVIYLGFFGTVLGFVWYYDGVKAIGPTRASIFINLVPAWAVMLSALILGENIVLATLIGGVVIIIGVTLTNLSRGKASVPDATEAATP